MDPADKKIKYKYLYYQNKCIRWSKKVNDIGSGNKMAMPTKIEGVQMQEQPKTSFKSSMQLAHVDVLS
jgi:hypothetical protein